MCGRSRLQRWVEKNKVGRAGEEVMEKERRKKQRVNQPFYKHSLGTYCALEF